MEIKILHIGVVHKDGQVLMRKKPEGSQPYAQTWYVFGGNVTGSNVDQPLIDIVRVQTGINISISQKIGWDTEVKEDHDGATKLFVYLDSMCSYESGEIVVGEGLETVEWIPIEKLSEYDVVPPSVKLFRKLGYL